MSQITEGQRYEISAYIQAGLKQKEIAARIGVHPSTISRELRRNCDMRSGKYNPELANRKHDSRMKDRNHFSKMNEGMTSKIDPFLIDGWSPEQISGRLKLLGEMSVSHETIYQYIYNDKKLKDKGKGLYRYLRRKGRKYAKRGCQYNSRGTIIGRVDIDNRPEIVNEKIRFGDLEGDTIIGKNKKGAIETINDRLTGFLWMRKLSGKEAEPLAEMTIKTLAPFSKIIHTLTVDNGKEFAKHGLIADALGIDVFFAHPYHSWERGANENTNGLIRQYIPKGSDFGSISDEFIANVQNALNNRPRKRLGFRTPFEVASELYPDFFN